MIRILRLAAVILTALAAATPAAAEIGITPKHLVIIRPGIDTIWGSYVFAIHNAGEAEAELKSEIMLPKETVDFMPQEGLTPDQVSLADGGGVRIDGKFPPGVHVVSIGFKVDARFGLGKLTFVPVSQVESFTVLRPRESPVKIASSILVRAANEESPDPQYDALTASEPLAVGKTYEIGVEGIPEGRSRLWIMGAVVGGLMVLLAFGLALRTRPKISQDSGDAILVG